MSRSSIGEAPFHVPEGSDHLYLDPVRRGALSILITSVGDGVPSVLVSGGPEIGKTSLMVALAEALAERRGVRLLRFEQVFQCSEETSLHDIVSSCQRPEQTVNVLLLDDADRLTEDVRDNLWSWAEQFRASVAPLTIVLSATPKPVLHDSASKLTELSQVADRVIALEPLSTKHLEAMIRHRLDAAGYGGPDPFTAAAIERIAFYSRGYPGRITRLCRHILSKPLAAGSLPLPASGVKDAAWDLFLPLSVKDRLKELQFGPYKTVASSRSAESIHTAASSPPRQMRKPPSMTVGTRNRSPVAAAATSMRRRSETLSGPPPTMLRAEPPVRVRMERRPEERFLEVGARLRRWMEREWRRAAREATRPTFWLADKWRAFTRWRAKPLSFSWAAEATEPVRVRYRAVRAQMPAAGNARRLAAGLSLPTVRMPTISFKALEERLQALLATSQTSLARRAAVGGLVLLVGGITLTYLTHGGSGQDEREVAAVAGPPAAAITTAAEARLDPAAENAGPTPIVLPGERAEVMGPMPMPVDDPRAAGPVGAEQADADQGRQAAAQPAEVASRTSAVTDSAPPAPARAQVEAAQRMLAGLGFDPGPIDGLMGPRTRGAIRAFRQSYGGAVDGEVNADLISDLEGRTKRAN
ncbi:MAG: peptidoglycan-binding protein [Rhodospirillales bacterium]|nr:peptidoglycan-binding protein [Rhodospirillales bacterium]